MVQVTHGHPNFLAVSLVLYLISVYLLKIIFIIDNQFKITLKYMSIYNYNAYWLRANLNILPLNKEH